MSRHSRDGGRHGWVVSRSKNVCLWPVLHLLEFICLSSVPDVQRVSFLCGIGDCLSSLWSPAFHPASFHTMFHWACGKPPTMPRTKQNNPKNLKGKCSLPLDQTSVRLLGRPLSQVSMRSQSVSFKMSVKFIKGNVCIVNAKAYRVPSQTSTLIYVAWTIVFC